MNTLDDNKPLIFLGDNHGDWEELFYRIQVNKLRDCYIISVGDCGIGFGSKSVQQKNILQLDSRFKENNIFFKAIRGNHDNPLFFQGNNRINLPHFELLEDYTVCHHRAKSIQFIGGAVSIDRTGRTENISYWSDEKVIFKESECKKVDVLITHTAPTFCFPQTFNEIVYGWAREDSFLINDLNEERALMDKIFNICSPSVHLYGHFHSSWTENINNCKHRLLNIDELWELKE